MANLMSIEDLQGVFEQAGATLERLEALKQTVADCELGLEPLQFYALPISLSFGLYGVLVDFVVHLVGREEVCLVLFLGVLVFILYLNLSSLQFRVLCLDFPPSLRSRLQLFVKVPSLLFFAVSCILHLALERQDLVA